MSEATAEPPLLVPPSGRPAAAIRIATGLIAFGALSFVAEVTNLAVSFRTLLTEGHGNLNLAAPLICFSYWLAAWFVLKDQRFIYAVIAYLTAGAIGVAIGASLAAAGMLPFKFIRAYAVHQAPLFWGYGASHAIALGFYAWLFGEATRVSWPTELIARRAWVRPRAFFIHGAAIAGLGVAGLLAFMNAGWTAEAKTLAREECGSGYDYRVVYYGFRSTNGHVAKHAVVIAYNDDELRRVVLDWEN